MILSELIGDMGKYQMWVCFIVSISQFGAGCHVMAIILLAPPATYVCPDSNNTCCNNPVYNQTIFKRTIVMEWNLICERSWLKNLTETLFQFGILVGSFLFGAMSDKLGRRPILMSCIVIEVFSGLISAFMPDYWSFTVVRMILGMSIGGLLVVGFVLVIEFVGPNQREIVASLIHIPFSIGIIFLALGSYWIRDYVYLQLGLSIGNLILFIYICYLPESPRWLLAIGKSNAAVPLLQRIAFINKISPETIPRKIDMYQMDHNLWGTHKRTIADILISPNLAKRILKMAFIWLACSLCFNGVVYYINHMIGDKYINVLSQGFVCLISCVILIFPLKHMSRIALVVICNVLCSMTILTIAIVPPGTASLVLCCIGILFSYSTYVVVYLYCTELFPTVVRNVALGLSAMMARLGALIAPFAAALIPYGHWCTPVIFGILPLFVAATCQRLPETKDEELIMTIEEVEAIGNRSSLSDE